MRINIERKISGMLETVREREREIYILVKYALLIMQKI